MSNKAYINNLSEEGSRAELIYWIKKLDGENDNLRVLVSKLEEELANVRQNLGVC